jgi:hypothetical protein
MQEQASVDQIKQRERRRAQLPVVYTGEFDLLAEVHDILAPLANQVAAERSPLTYRPYVDKLTGAVHTLAVKVADLVATADARRAAAHLPIEQRGRAVKMLRDLAVRPLPPAITDAEITSGAWANTLTGHCCTYCGQLSDLLSRAAPSDSRRGAPSVSETLVEALRVLDHASTDAQRQLDKAAFLRRELGARSDSSSGTEGVRSELAALGIAT